MNLKSIPPPEVAIKLNDNLVGLAEVLVPALANVRALTLDMGIDAHAVTATIDGTSDYQHHISLDADLPRFALDGKLYFDWPANKTGFGCLFSSDYHFEIPLAIRGATVDTDAVVSAFQRLQEGLLSVNLQP